MAISSKLSRGEKCYFMITLIVLVVSSIFTWSFHLQATIFPTVDYQVEDVQVQEDYGITSSITYELEQKSSIVGFEQGKHSSSDYSIIPSFTEAEENLLHTGARNWMQYSKK